MANEQNLVSLATRPERERKEIAKKGQEASVKAKQEKKTFKAMLLLALEEINAETGKTKREELNEALIDKALKGDTKAFEVIRDTVGEKPIDKVQANVFNYEESLKAVDGDEY